MPTKSDKPSQRLVILNLPELGAAPPEWVEVEGVFRGASDHVMVRAFLLMLIGQREEARKLKEGTPGMPAEEGKFWDGLAKGADELIEMVMKLVRGKGEKIDLGVREIFGAGAGARRMEGKDEG